MKHIFDIAIKDIRQSLRDKQTFMFLLAMPIIFTILFGFAFGGLSFGKEDPRLLVGYQDYDGSEISLGLRGFMENQSDIRIMELEGSVQELEKQVVDEQLVGVVIIPEGFGQALKSGQPLKLEVIVDLSSVNGVAAQNAIQAAVGKTASAAAAARIASGENADTFTENFKSAESAWSNTPVGLKAAEASAVQSSQTSSLLPLSHTAPAMMIQFSLAGLLTAAQVLVHERKTRCMQRLLTTRAARHEILLGHFLAIFLVIFVQFILLIGFGQWILHLDYLRLPLATLVMTISTALFVSAVGLLIGALARSDEQAVIFAMAPMFILSAVGGAWMPLAMTGEAFRTIGQVTPVALALDGFQNILARGLAFNSILLPAAALLGYALVCFGLAVWRFKFE